MPMLKLLKAYDYGGATQPIGTKITVSQNLFNWLVRQRIGEPVGGAVPITGVVAQAAAREQPALLQSKFRRCKPCGW